MENEWADWTRRGYQVDYNMDVYPPSSQVPDRFDVEYVVRDPETGEVIYENSNRFRNRDGETFDRVPFRDMPSRN